MPDPILSIREITHNDIPHVVNYWMSADSEFLHNMGVDLKKMLTAEQFTTFLTAQVNLPIEQRISNCVIWLENGIPVGHSNTNPTNYGEDAFMHLHLWEPGARHKGVGTEFVKLSVRYFFDKLKLNDLYCQPYALNPAPNKVLERLGFEFVKEYITVPGMINYEQPVKLWHMSSRNMF